MSNTKYSNEYYENILNTIIEIGNKNGITPTFSELNKCEGIKFDVRDLDKYLKNNTKYKDHKEFFHQNGLMLKNEVKVRDKFISSNKLTIDDIVWLHKDFNNKKGRLPYMAEYVISNNLPSTSMLYKILRKNQMIINDLWDMVGKKHHIKDIDEYDNYLSKYIEISNSLGRPLMYKELFKNQWGIPSASWFISHCPHKNIKTFSDFVEYAGFKPTQNISKEKATEIIFKMQNALDRPIMKKDLNNTNLCGEIICESTIKRHWGTINKMKKELGIEITGENMKAKEKSIEEIKRDVEKVCDYIFKTENRKTITLADWKKLNDVASYQACERHLKLNNSSIRKYVSALGFELQKAGNGLNYTFDDGEKVMSQYEFDFTRLLKSINLKYNIDYTRSIRYKEFCKDYNGLLDCDYVIKYQGKIIYIEIAGVLRDYKKTWHDKVLSSSKSKEKYRQHLLTKEKLFIDNNLEYYILFPCDITKKKFKEIFNIDNNSEVV